MFTGKGKIVPPSPKSVTLGSLARFKMQGRGIILAFCPKLKKLI
jgi:hypothetical protein